jgi:hypothetical protein
MRRAPVLATLLLFVVALAACGGSPATITIPTPGLGISLHEAEQFFNKQGGGGWKFGEYTGGTVGYAAGNASGQFCPTQLSGRTKELNRIYVGCESEELAEVTPQEAAAVIEATVHRVVPAATGWAREATASLTTTSSSATPESTKTYGPTYLSITQAPAGGMLLTIEPKVVATAQRLPGTSQAASTTS